MTVKELISLLPIGTVLFIQTEVYHPDAEPPFGEIFGEEYTVGSSGRIPSAQSEVTFINPTYSGEMDVQTETMYV